MMLDTHAIARALSARQRGHTCGITRPARDDDEWRQACEALGDHEPSTPPRTTALLLALTLLAGPLIACADSPTAPTVVEPDRDVVDDDRDDRDDGNGDDDDDTDPPVSTGPPFQGTVFISPAVITGTDPTRLRDVEHTGRGERAVFDRRNGAWTTEEVRLFDVCSRPRGNAEFWTRVDRKMLWWPGHRQTDRFRVCSPASRRVAALRPRFRGAHGLDAGSAHAVQTCPCLTMPHSRPPRCCGRPSVQIDAVSDDR